MGVYQEVYIEEDGVKKVSIKLKESLNEFLEEWLSNCIEQKHVLTKVNHDLDNAPS